MCAKDKKRVYIILNKQVGRPYSIPARNTIPVENDGADNYELSSDEEEIDFRALSRKKEVTQAITQPSTSKILVSYVFYYLLLLFTRISYKKPSTV